MDECYCDLPWTEIFVVSDGRVFFCCHNKFPLGTVVPGSVSFMDVWNGEIAQEVREYIKKGKMHPMCDSLSCPNRAYFLNGKLNRK